MGSYIVFQHFLISFFPFILLTDYQIFECFAVYFFACVLSFFFFSEDYDCHCSFIEMFFGSFPPLTFVIQLKTDDIARIYQPKRYALSPKTTITLAHLLAAREDLSKIIRTSSGSSREKTACAINKVGFSFKYSRERIYNILD